MILWMSQKKDAVNEMITLTDIAEKESNAEMMLEAKGFTDVVVSMNDDGCDVVLNMGRQPMPSGRRSKIL